MMETKPTKSDSLSAKTEIQKDAMIKALTRTLGVVTSACKKVGISRDTHYDWFNNDEAYKKRVEDIKDVAIDFVESKMFQAIRNNDSSLMKYFLGTQARKRGYSDKVEIEHSGQVENTTTIIWGDGKAITI